MIRRIWSDPVWSKVIASLLITFFSAVVAYAYFWWPSIASAANALASMAVDQSTLPNWVIWLLLLLSAAAALIVLFAFRNWIRPRTSGETEWQSYVEDNFKGLKWRWKFGDHPGEIYDVCCFCPKCDFQLFPYDSSPYGASDRIGFYCDECSIHLGEHEESFSSLNSRIERHIQQKIRNRAYPKPI